MRELTSPAAPDPRRNLLLGALPAQDLAHFAPLLKPVALDYREVLYHPGEPLSHVYFPISGLVSMIALGRDSGSVEVGPVGRDGMIGLPVFLGAESDPLQAFAQIVPCHALCAPAAAFRDAAEDLPGLQFILRRYVQWTYFGMAQWVLCARLHPVEERLGRWLLMCHDRVGQETFPLTHEFLAEMLGVRRASVTLAAMALRRAGLIEYRRGVVTILDREALEDASCECWRVSSAEYVRLFGQPPG